MDRFYYNPFATYRRSPDNYLNSTHQDYSTQDLPASSNSFYPSFTSMATTDYFRPSNPPSDPSSSITSPSRIASPHGLAISLQSYSAPNHPSGDDRVTTSLGSSRPLLPPSKTNPTSTYSAPGYQENNGTGEQILVGGRIGVGNESGEVWKRSPHAEIGGTRNIDSNIGEPNSFSSNKSLSGLGLGYSKDDGRSVASPLSSTLAEGGKLGYTSTGTASYQASPSSQGLATSAFPPQTPSVKESHISGAGDSGGGSSDGTGSSRGSGKRASGLPIETASSYNSSHSSLLHQAHPSNSTPTPSGPIQIDQSNPLQVQTFFPDNGEAGIPITIIATLNSDWASKIGLQLSDEGFEGIGPRTRLIVTFGAEDVEVKVERSFNPNDNTSRSTFNVNIIAVAPPFAGTQWTSTRVPLVLNVGRRDSRDGHYTFLPGGGIEVGEFNYWLVSPRSTLKRFGEPLEEEGNLENPAKQSSSGLRRPASYPALSSNDAGPSSLEVASATDSNSLGRSTGAGLNRSISHNRGAGSTSSSHSLNPSTHAMRHYRSDMGMSSSSPSQSSFGSPAIGSDRISGDFTFAVRPNSIGIPQGSFAGMGISGSSGAISPGGLSRPDFSMDSDSRPVTANTNSTTMHSPAPSFDDRQLSHSNSINSLSGSLSSMRRGSAGYSPALPGSSTFSPHSPSSNLPPKGNKNSSRPPPVKKAPSVEPQTTVRAGSRALLQMHGELQDMAVGWSHDEYMSSRRLVQFWRRQDGTTIHMTFRPILPEQYVQNSIVISCIFREDKNECFITSVDLIYLLEALVASRFTVEEKNRIRRNLEGFKPSTVAKGKNDSSEFFKVIMNFPNPKPRNIEKDVKVFPWSVLGKALSKIIGKYSAAPAPAPQASAPSNESSTNSYNHSPQVQPSPSFSNPDQNRFNQNHQSNHLNSSPSNFSPSPSGVALGTHFSSPNQSGNSNSNGNLNHSGSYSSLHSNRSGDQSNGSIIGHLQNGNQNLYSSNRITSGSYDYDHSYQQQQQQQQQYQQQQQQQNQSSSTSNSNSNPHYSSGY